MSDLFHEKAPLAYIKRAFEAMNENGGNPAKIILTGESAGASRPHRGPAGAADYTHQTGTQRKRRGKRVSGSKISSMSFLSRPQCRDLDRIMFKIFSCVCGLNGQGASLEFLRFRFALQLSKQEGLIVKDFSDREAVASKRRHADFERAAQECISVGITPLMTVNFT
jgi:hypothetical protein